MKKCHDDAIPVVTLLLLGSLAFAHLLALPVFADEGRQVSWIWRVIEAGEWLRPLGEGKPLEVWPMVPLVLWLGFDPLTAARALHVLAGMIGAVLTYRLALQLSDRTTAFVSGALFAICPFVVYLQRLALSDMFMCIAGVWVLASVLRLIESPTGRRATTLGLAFVLAAFCKFPVGFAFLASLPLALLLMPAPERRRLLHRPAVTRAVAAHIPATCLALAVLVVAILRLRHGQLPGFGIQDVLGKGLGHESVETAMGVPRPTLLGELTAQLSWAVTVIGLIGLIAGAALNGWRQRWLIAMGALPLLAIGLLAGFFFSRYLLFTLPPLIVATVAGWRALAARAGLWRRPLELGALAPCVAIMAHQSALLIVDPLAANWSRVDRFQYFEAPGSGFGYPEAAQFVRASPAAPRMIYSLDNYSAYQLLTYLATDWRGRIKPIFYRADGKVARSNAERMENLLGGSRAWLIVPEQLLRDDLESSFGSSNPDQLRLRQVAAFNKPGMHARLAIYEVMHGGP